MTSSRDAAQSAIEAIDNVLDDNEVSHDAMRWVPEPAERTSDADCEPNHSRRS